MNNIPKTIYLCYKNKNIPDYVINNLKTHNPAYEISINDDNDCKNFLYKYFGQKYVDGFDKIKHGPIKADFWRVCVLYINGGIYCDIDIEPRIGFDSIIEDQTIFLTSTSKEKKYLNPIILASYPSNTILEKCIDIYIQEKFINPDKYSYWGWSICPIMHQAFFTVTGVEIINGTHKEIIYNDQKYQFLTESIDKKRKYMRTTYKDIVVCNNHYPAYQSRSNGIGFR